MAEWNLFQFGSPRPDTEQIYTEADRNKLEREVARRIADLLSRFGEVEEDIEVDRSGCVVVEEPQTFAALLLESTVLEDDSELFIGQIPPVHGDFLTDPGSHLLHLADTDDVTQLELAVYDPQLKHEPPIESCDGPIDLDTLVETVDALRHLQRQYELDVFPNDPPHDTMAYPLRVSSPEFESLVAAFNEG